jgi:hypothetical protein
VGQLGQRCRIALTRARTERNGTTITKGPIMSDAYIDTRTLAEFGYASHDKLYAAVKEMHPDHASQWMLAIRVAELAVLIDTLDDPEEQQRMVDQFNRLLAFTSVRYRLTPVA